MVEDTCRGVVFDLDETLVDTSPLSGLREERNWRGAVQRLHLTHVYPNIRETLQYLREHAIPWAVVTTSVSYYARSVLDHHGIDCHELIAYHDVEPKPSPAPICLAIERLGVACANSLGVGDSEYDLKAYRAAGIQALGAGWTSDLWDGEWDSVLHDPGDLVDLLQ